VEEKRQVRFLVDGQQRFTTLHLLFLHLHRAASAWGQRDVERNFDRVITDYVGSDRPQFRIDIEERREALEALYRDRPYELPARASLSVRNLHDRSLQIGELLEELLEADRCQLFVDWLLTKVVMVGIRAPSRDSGFRIFESMNDRGARLTPVDLLKSFLLSNARTGEEKLNEAWRRMLAELTGVRDDFDAPRKFLKAALLARYANVGEGDPTDGENIDAALNIWVRRNTDRLGLRQSDDYFHFVEDLIRLAGHHRTFLEASRHLYDKSGLEALYYNEVNGLTNQMALILAAVQPRDILSQAKEKAALVANFLDRLYVEGTLNDEPVQAKDFEPDIHRLIPQLRKCSTPQDVSALLSAALPTTAFEPVATFGMRGNNKAQVRYLLARLRRDRLPQTQPHRRLPRRGTHLADRAPLRQPPPAPPRRDTRPRPVTFRTLRARLGVLVLLRRSDNASYNDLPLETKRRRYARENLLAAILAPDHRKNNPALKMPRVVEVRGELYRRLCAQIWAPAALGFSVPPQHPDHAATPAADQDHTTAPARTRALRTDLVRMMQAHVLAPGTQIDGEHRGIRYTATVDENGVITMPSGDHFASADEAGKMIRGTQRCAGMAFWHVTTADGHRMSLRELRTQPQQDGRLARARQM
jgi:hypothetical protein